MVPFYQQNEHGMHGTTGLIRTQAQCMQQVNQQGPRSAMLALIWVGEGVGPSLTPHTTHVPMGCHHPSSFDPSSDRANTRHHSLSTPETSAPCSPEVQGSDALSMPGSPHHGSRPSRGNIHGATHPPFMDLESMRSPLIVPHFVD